MNVRTDGNTIKINGRRGPLQEYYQQKIVPDSTTRTDVDLGRIGGPRMATADFKGNSLIVYLHKISDNTIDVITTITINPEKPDQMTYIVKDVASGIELIQTLYKQNL